MTCGFKCGSDCGLKSKANYPDWMNLDQINGHNSIKVEVEVELNVE